MPVDQFEGFVVGTSGQSVVFSVAKGSTPLWVIDTTLLAGSPVLTIGHGLNAGTPKIVGPPPGKVLDRHILNIALTNARYPGTNIAADLSMAIIEVITTEDTTFSVDLNLSFGGVSFSWADDEFAKWLNGGAPMTAPVNVLGPVINFQGGGNISFGPAATGTLTFAPGVLTVAAADVCTIAGFGVVGKGSLLRIVPSNSSAQTGVLVQSSQPYVIPLSATTPLGTLGPQPGFDTITVTAAETAQTAAFTSTQPRPLYTLQVLDGIRDLSGIPVSLR